MPKDHPRYGSLQERHRLVAGLKEGVLAEAGLIAHGRGEAFDYLLGEKTSRQAYAAEKAAVALMLLSKSPVVSVNGNVAVLAGKDAVKLADALDAKMEINLFYRSEERMRLIEKLLKKAGAKKVYGAEKTIKIQNLSSERGKVDPEGIYAADTVLVPLEDGDRLEALNSLGKNTIAIDLNPLSRTSQKASVSIVDNVVRALPNMTRMAKDMKAYDIKRLQRIASGFDNRKNLSESLDLIRKGVV